MSSEPIVGDMLRNCFDDIHAEQERWLQAQADERGLTHEQFAAQFSLEVRDEWVANGITSRFVRHLRLLQRSAP